MGPKPIDGTPEKPYERNNAENQFIITTYNSSPGRLRFKVSMV
jgi:hypothetical protein